MDTRCIQNGTYNINGTQKPSCLPSPKTAQYRGSGSLYTMTGSGAQVFMNSHTIVTATNLQFVPQIRHKSTMCNCKTASILEPMHFNETIKMPSPTSAPASAPASPQLNGNSKMFIENETKTDGSPLLSAIKGFLTYLIRPIIHTANVRATNLNYLPFSMATDNNNYSTSNKNSETSNMYMNFMPDMDNLAFFDCDDFIDSEDTVDFIGDRTPQFNLIKNEKMPLSPDPSSSPKSYVFFDCVSNFETPIELIETPMTINLPTEAPMPKQLNSTTDNTFEIVKSITEIAKNPSRPYPNDSDAHIHIEPVENFQNSNVMESSTKCITTKEKLKYKRNRKLSNLPQPQTGNFSGNNEKVNNSCRRKNRKKRRNKNKAVHRQKSSTTNKNRNEKFRHELELNIHDDIEECIFEQGLDDCYNKDNSIETDIEMVERCDVRAMPSISLTTDGPSAQTTFVENTTRLAERGRSGCMFTSFINFEMPNIVRKLRTAPRLLSKRCQRKMARERPLHRSISETESEDNNFIVFDENSPQTTPSIKSIACDLTVPRSAFRKAYTRQRQISECSDDFICFEYDDSEPTYCIQHDDDTTDEEVTDSDVSDDDDSSDTDSNDSDLEHVVDCTSLENNPPDSGFEEKKVK